jgi:hypothetical protein
MPVGSLFSLNDQAAPADERDRLHAAADSALAEAEYEFYALQADLQAALEVPLRHRAIAVTPPEAPTSDEPEKAESLASLLTRLRSAAA